MRILFSLCALLLIAAAPAPTGHVNDFANVIPDDREAVIEQSLRAYEKQTTIEIAVATVPSLDCQSIEDYAIATARQWGVGKAGANNGVLVVIAPGERKYRIEVGYGLEGDLTDADSGTLARKILPPAFRAGDYGGGVAALTDALIEHLGTLTPAQRAEIKQKAEAEERRQSEIRGARMRENLATIGLIVVAGTAVFGALYGINALIARRRARIRDAKRREVIRTKIAEVTAGALDCLTELEAIDLPNLPAWLQDDKERLSAAVTESLEAIAELERQIVQCIEDDLPKAEGLGRTLEISLLQARDRLTEIRDLPDQVAIYRQQCEEEVASACRAIEKLLERAHQLQGTGYRVRDLVAGFDADRLAAERQSIQTLLANRGEGPADASEVVHNKATRLLRRVETMHQSLEAKIQTHHQSAIRIEELDVRAQSLQALRAEHHERIARLKNLAPASRWAAFVEGLPVFERALGGIEPRLSAARRENTLEVQLFDDASATLDAAYASLQSIDETVRAAQALEQSIRQAEQSYPEALRTAMQALAQAKPVLANSDVGAGAKSRLEEARRLLDQASVVQRENDWIAVSELLAQAASKAAQAQTIGRNDIDTAERERKRRADQQKRDRELRDNLSTFSVGSGGSSGGFGGFGGGGFGGGGAGGGW